jgi:predicted transcriptional regulator
MSWKPVQKVLSRLVANGLITELTSSERAQSKRRYLITEKGSEIIKYFNDAKDILQVEGMFR